MSKPHATGTLAAVQSAWMEKKEKRDTDLCICMHTYYDRGFGV